MRCVICGDTVTLKNYGSYVERTSVGTDGSLLGNPEGEWLSGMETEVVCDSDPSHEDRKSTRLNSSH